MLTFDTLITKAAQMRASDIHLSLPPFMVIQPQS